MHGLVLSTLANLSRGLEFSFSILRMRVAITRTNAGGKTQKSVGAKMPLNWQFLWQFLTIFFHFQLIKNIRIKEGQTDL